MTGPLLEAVKRKCRKSAIHLERIINEKSEAEMVNFSFSVSVLIAGLEFCIV